MLIGVVNAQTSFLRLGLPWSTHADSGSLPTDGARRRRRLRSVAREAEPRGARHDRATLRNDHTTPRIVVSFHDHDHAWCRQRGLKSTRARPLCVPLCPPVPTFDVPRVTTVVDTLIVFLLPPVHFGVPKCVHFRDH